MKKDDVYGLEYEKATKTNRENFISEVGRQPKDDYEVWKYAYKQIGDLCGSDFPFRERIEKELNKGYTKKEKLLLDDLKRLLENIELSISTIRNREVLEYAEKIRGNVLEIIRDADIMDNPFSDDADLPF